VREPVPSACLDSASYDTHHADKKKTGWEACSPTRLSSCCSDSYFERKYRQAASPARPDPKSSHVAGSGTDGGAGVGDAKAGFKP
jgi:hypothetical protein